MLSFVSHPAYETPIDRIVDAPEAITSLISGITGMGSQKASQVIERLTSKSQRGPWIVFQEITAPELIEQGFTIRQANKLIAAIDFGKRVFTAPPKSDCVNEPGVAAKLLEYELAFSTTEKAALLILDHKHQLIAKEIFSIGSKSECIVEPSIIFEKVLRNRGTRYIIAHSHPTGNTEPSNEDIDITKHLLNAGKIMNIPMLDHIIMSQGHYTSLHTLMPELQW